MTAGFPFQPLAAPSAEMRHALCVGGCVADDGTSPDALVEVLRAAGFRLVHEGPDTIQLRRGARWLQVPKNREVLAQRWADVLAAAGMDSSTYRVLSLGAHAMVSELPSSRKIRSAPPSGSSPSGSSNDGE